MPSSPDNLYTAAQTRELDRITIESGYVPGYTLMGRAGQAVFDHLRLQWPDARRITILCGAGNNAGDGYVIARLAREAGCNSHVMYLSEPEKLSGDAKTAWQDCIKADVAITTYSAEGLEGSDVIVDALLGTGLDREVTGSWAEAIDDMNQHPMPVIAVDIPSGIRADTGHVLGNAVHAAITVTFIGMKRGLLTGQAPDFTGQLVLESLEVPDEVYQQVPRDCQLLTAALLDCLPVRARTSHKGSNGHVLVVGGNYGFAGAALMVGQAALRSGAGLVSIATRSEHVVAMVSAQPELMVHGIAQQNREGRRQLSALLRRCTHVVIGPGLGQDEWSSSCLDVVLESDKPVVIDADALNLLAQEPRTGSNHVLTPHAGEAARLLGCSITEVNMDRFHAVHHLQQRYGGVGVLKGAGTLVSGDSTAVCDRGNPGMASGGMGDMLSGVIGGLMAQGLSLEDAARLGVWVHAMAGDQAASKGERGTISTDLLPSIRLLL
ncbi:MAG: NAD(P)H-hydrate dehydratase, partial [Gammaproteobacteria bacterium]